MDSDKEMVMKTVKDLTDLELADAYPTINRIIAQCNAELEAVTIEVNRRKQRAEKPDESSND